MGACRAAPLNPQPETELAPLAAPGRINGADRGPREDEPGAEVQRAVRESCRMPAGATLGGDEWAPLGKAFAWDRNGICCPGALRAAGTAADPQVGATADEVRHAYPGDELVPDPDGGATMATTLPARPDRVWPWLVQMGGDRGGWYSWDWLDNKSQASADRIVPEWQTLAVGQHLKGPTNWWTVAVVEPNRTLVLRSSYSLSWPVGQSFDPQSGPLPRAYVDGVWGFHLRPAAGGGTRLVVRTRAQSRPRSLTRPLGLLVFEPVHLIMQTRQFHNLRRQVTAPL